MKLFYEPTEQQYYVLYQSPGKDLIYKVDQVKPMMLSMVMEHALFLTGHDKKKIIEEIEEFIRKKLEDLNYNF